MGDLDGDIEFLDHLEELVWGGGGGGGLGSGLKLHPPAHWPGLAHRQGFQAGCNIFDFYPDHLGLIIPSFASSGIGDVGGVGGGRGW